MTNKLRIKVLGILFVLLVLMSGCFTLPKTTEGKYAASLRAFNDAVEIYAQHYDIATLETQERWKKEIDPLIVKASTALDLWWMAIQADEGAIAKGAAYNQLWRELSRALFKYGIMEVQDD